MATHRRLQEEVWRDHRVGALDELTTDTVRAHFLPAGLPPGREGLKLFVSGYLAAFPDGFNTIDAHIGDDNHSVMRLTFAGTHTGPLLDISATGRRVTISGMEMWRLTPDAKLAEGWAAFDLLGLMQQLGVVPTP
jgi:predicted ester cyclase